MTSPTELFWKIEALFCSKRITVHINTLSGESEHRNLYLYYLSQKRCCKKFPKCKHGCSCLYMFLSMLVLCWVLNLDNMHVCLMVYLSHMDCPYSTHTQMAAKRAIWHSVSCSWVLIYRRSLRSNHQPCDSWMTSPTCWVTAAPRHFNLTYFSTCANVLCALSALSTGKKLSREGRCS